MGKSGLIAASHAGTGPDIICLVDGISSWCHALQGQIGFHQGLRALAKGFGAEAVSIVKSAKDGEGQIRSLSVDLNPSGRLGKIDEAFVDLIIGSYLPDAKVGSVWYASMAKHIEAARLVSLRRNRGVSEIATIILGQDTKWVYVLEIHFSNRINSDTNALLMSMSDTLCKSWACRSAGSFSEALLERRQARTNFAMSAPILSDANPARLSRAEFRVCLLLSHGLSRDALTTELHITKSTLRTHLRQICAKTDSESVEDLAHRLIMSTRRPGMPAVPAASAARYSA